jgi:site-specific DNA-methyltransferase (adenine-specific)
MRERLMEIHRILKPTGSLYLHCDWHAAHYLKVMLDDVFGENHFQNEVIWYYRGAGVSPRRWARRHDSIFFYTKGKEWTFNPDPVRGEYADATKERFKHYIGNVRGEHDFGVQQLNPKGKHPDDVWEISIVAPSAKERLGRRNPRHLWTASYWRLRIPTTSCSIPSAAAERHWSRRSDSGDGGSGSTSARPRSSWKSAD